MNLSEIEPLQVMLSSRASDKITFEGKSQELSVLWRAIKTQLESLKIGDVCFFKVWIHEDEPFQPGNADSWEKCMEKARRADLVIVLYNGRADGRWTAHLVQKLYQIFDLTVKNQNDGFVRLSLQRGHTMYLKFVVISLAVCLLFGVTPRSKAQTTEEVRTALASLRSDDQLYNCSRAISWLLVYRETLKDELVNELYRTDRQGRDAILHILFNTKSFKPDIRFKQFVLARLPEQDSRVRNYDILYGTPEIFESKAAFEEANEKGQDWGTVQAHWEAWKYINANFNDFDRLLTANLAHTTSAFVLWGTTWLFDRHGVLNQKLAYYTPQVLSRAADNLKNDGQQYNATHAIRTFLMLNRHGLPVLTTAARSSDPQQRYLAQALIDAISSRRNRNAFGFLNAHGTIYFSLIGEEDQEPEWMREATQKYLDQETPKYP
jgi:hypothetical protein